MKHAHLETFVASLALVAASPVCSLGCSSSSGGAGASGSGTASDAGTADAPAPLDGAREGASDAYGPDAASDVALDCGVEVTPPIGTYTTSQPISDCTCDQSDTSCNTSLVVEALGWGVQGEPWYMEVNAQPAAGTLPGNEIYTTLFGPPTPSCATWTSYTAACPPADACGGMVLSNPGTPIDTRVLVYASDAEFQAAPDGDTKYAYVWAVWGWPSSAQTVTEDAYNPVPLVFKKVCH
jgi:hypothetical protein